MLSFVQNCDLNLEEEVSKLAQLMAFIVAVGHVRKENAQYFIS